MNQQMIISIGREFGSAGHEIAKKLAEHFNLPIYDHDLLKEMVEFRKMDERVIEELEEFDETKRNKLLSRTVKGYNNSPAYNVAYLQFDFLEKKAESGESFVVVGRCSETILKDYPGLISIFVLGDMDKKIERIMELYNLSEKKAEAFINEKDRERREYHNSYCKGRWGDSRNYDLTINSSRLGVEDSTKLLIDYINARRRA